MDPALYYEIHKEEVDERVISRYTKYIKLYYFYNLTKDYVWRDYFKIKSRGETLAIIAN